MDILLDGTLAGTGNAVGSPQVTLPLTGVLDGVVTLTGEFSLKLLFGGQLRGVGEFGLNFPSFSGTLDGAGEATLGTPIGVVNARGRADGRSMLQEVVPMPIYGVGVITGLMEIETASSPLCCCCTGPTTFAWGESLGEKLTLCITTPSGQPFAPVRISYALYYVKGQARFLVGSPARTPSPDSLGCYHATGFLGDCGQPGSWLIVWTYCDGGEPVSVEQPFEVTAGPPITNPCGCASHGWE